MEKYTDYLSQNIFSPSDFDLQSLHQEKSRKKNVGDANEEEDTGPKSDKATHQAIGIINVFHHTFGLKGEEGFKDLCILKEREYENYVFSDVPHRLKSILFTITAQVNISKGKKIRQKWEVFRCTRVEWAPRPFTAEVLETMMDLLGMMPEETDVLLGDGPIRHLEDGTPVFDSEYFFQRAVNHDSQKVRDTLLFSEQTKMYFQSHVFKLLCPDYYSEDIIACLNW